MAYSPTLMFLLFLVMKLADSLPPIKADNVFKPAKDKEIATAKSTKTLPEKNFPVLDWETGKLLEDSNLSFENYQIIYNDFIEKFRVFKSNVINYKSDLESKVKYFVNKLTFKLEDIKLTINTIGRSSDCPGTNCIQKNCEIFVPDKTRFASYFKLHGEILLNDFEKHIASLDMYYNEMVNEANSTKETIKFIRSVQFLNKSYKQFNTWQKDVFTELIKAKERLFDNCYYLSELIPRFGQKFDRLKQNFIGKIKEQLESFVCCTKEISIDTSGLDCGKMESAIKKRFVLTDLEEIEESEEEDEEENDINS